MGLRETAAIIASKSTKTILRLLGRGGTTLPGRIALKLCPEVLALLAKNVHCVIITGTNGKTTSARIVEQILAEEQVTYFANRSGANLITGITTEFINNCTLTGKPKKQYAVIECDEAASKEVCRLINPETVLVTNVFRDQLDRFGEVTYTLNNIIIGIKNSPRATVCLNADCSLSVSIADQIPNNIIYFGVDVPIYTNPVDEVSDATRCIKCTHQYEYSYHTFGHLGGFSCPNCGYKRPAPQIAVTEIVNLSADFSTVKISAFGNEDEYIVNLPGGYNIYNAAGALAVSKHLGFDHEKTKCAIAGFNCGFGRMEQFDMGKTSARMILIKNPAGCNQVLNYLGELPDTSVFVCCLNDRIADGTDISWIWDANFEKLLDMGERLDRVLISGVRRADMAVRLKYAGLPLEKLHIIDDYDRLIAAMSTQELPVVIMPTYTAMMELREKMSSVFGGGDFWE